MTHEKADQAALLFAGTVAPEAVFDDSDIGEQSPFRPAVYQGVDTGEVLECIRSIRRRKASGPDGLKNELLQLTAEEVAPLLAPIFSAAARDGVFPEDWKVATTIIILKARKKDYTNPLAYRPIALLNSMGKLFELILARRLERWEESYGILEQGHLGGRKGLGTEDALFVADSWVRNKWREGKVVAALFLDVKLAYPSVQPARLVHYLKACWCPTYLIPLIADLLSGRSRVIKMEDFVLSRFEIGIGLPQGSPLSVILYILYNNSLLAHSLQPRDDRILIGYIDNVIHMVAARSL